MLGLRLIVGLGNPGSEYIKTRHNAGFRFVDGLVQREGQCWALESRCLLTLLVCLSLGNGYGYYAQSLL